MVLRDHEGNCIALKTELWNDLLDVHEGEAWGLHQGLCWAASQGITELMIETDAREVSEAVSSTLVGISLFGD